MARPNKIPTDPKVYAELLENLAKGLPTRLIEQAIGVPEETIRGWKRRKDFKRDLAIATMKVLARPLNRFYEGTLPLTILQVHPETREIFRPPKQESDETITITIKDPLSDANRPPK